MRYIDFLNFYCGKNEYQRAAWSYVNPLDAMRESERIKIKMHKDFKFFTDSVEIEILTELCLINRLELEYELNKILGFKQYG